MGTPALISRVRYCTHSPAPLNPDLRAPATHGPYFVNRAGEIWAQAARGALYQKLDGYPTGMGPRILSGEFDHLPLGCPHSPELVAAGVHEPLLTAGDVRWHYWQQDGQWMVEDMDTLVAVNLIGHLAQVQEGLSEQRKAVNAEINDALRAAGLPLWSGYHFQRFAQGIRRLYRWDMDHHQWVHMGLREVDVGPVQQLIDAVPALSPAARQKMSEHITVLETALAATPR